MIFGRINHPFSLGFVLDSAVVFRAYSHLLTDCIKNNLALDTSITLACQMQAYPKISERT